MNPSRGAIAYGKEAIDFSVIYKTRKTLEIAVHPDRTIVVKAPIVTKFAEIVRRVAKRAGWIKRQLNYFRQFDPRTPSRKYVGGETHFYLGRQYRLKICRGKSDSVKLTGRHFKIQTNRNYSSEKTKSLLEAWYSERTENKFNESLNRWWPYFEKLSFIRPTLRARKMQTRWGSLSKNRVLTLNSDLIRAPKECIDYVVAHELCHLAHHNHGKDFYKLMCVVMPDWKSRKLKLELAMK